MAKVQKSGDSKAPKTEAAPKKPLAVKGAAEDVDVKSAEVELEQDELAAFKAAKRAEEEEGLNRVIRDVTARKTTGASTVSLEGFDWEAFDRKGFGEGYNSGDRDKMMKLYSGTVATVSNSEVVKGTVVGINNRDVILNIGFKSDGLVPLAEFKDMPNLKIGDEVDLFIEERENAMGQLVLSRRKAKLVKGWEYVQTALDKDEVIEGFVKRRTKGGLIVDVFGIEAFLPGSQIDVKPIRDYDQFVGKNMEFKVVKINQEFKNVVVSHKALIEAELEAQKKQIIGGLEKGQVLEGTVKNITSYGVFVDLGGVDGLIHITDLSWGRVSHPEEIVKLDDKINVVILDFDDEKRRIALGLKQLSAHPWDALGAEIEVGAKVKGKVMVITDYGAFVEVAPGVEGLLHVSEMSWSQHLRSPKDFLKEGQEIECMILNIDREERKMSLGMKQLLPDPWTDIEFRYPVGSRHTAKVRSLTNFGIFAELEEGIDGLVHISDLSWTKRIKHPSELFAVGDSIEVQVLEVDKENRRLSLGHKQVEQNPWEVFATVFTPGSVHEGTLVGRSGQNFTVALPYGIEGTVSARHLKKADGGKAELEEKLPFVVLEFNGDARRIVVSHSRFFDFTSASTQCFIAACAVSGVRSSSSAVS